MVWNFLVDDLPSALMNNMPITLTFLFLIVGVWLLFTDRATPSYYFFLAAPIVGKAYHAMEFGRWSSAVFF